MFRSQAPSSRLLYELKEQRNRVWQKNIFNKYLIKLLHFKHVCKNNKRCFRNKHIQKNCSQILYKNINILGQNYFY